MINKHCGHRRTVEGCADCRIAELEVEAKEWEKRYRLCQEFRTKEKAEVEKMVPLSKYKELEQDRNEWKCSQQAYKAEAEELRAE